MDIWVAEIAPFNPSLVRLALMDDELQQLRELPFNPSLVRLAPLRSVDHVPERSAFQSQLGSIGATDWTPRMSSTSCFQSQLGSIGAAREGEIREYWPELSIPAWFDWRARTSARAARTASSFNPSLVRLARHAPYTVIYLAENFQSQLGSIGARLDAAGCPRLMRPFNPSLVRLAPYRTRKRYSTSSPFNPSLVRLALVVME